MSIEEQTKNALELLRSSYAATKNESLKISDKVLVECGLNNEVFWKVICPRLQSEGILAQYGDILGTDDDLNLSSYDGIDSYVKEDRSLVANIAKFYVFKVNSQKFAPTKKAIPSLRQRR